MSVVRLTRKNLRTIPELEESVKEVDVSCNFIASLSATCLVGHRLLTHLYLNCNELSRLPDFGEVSGQLEVLHLNNNKISSIDNMERLTKLRVLNLRANRITELGGLSNNTSIEWLSVSGNMISTIHVDQLGCCRSLRFLGLFANLLASFANVCTLLTTCVNLEEATVGRNPFCGGLSLARSPIDAHIAAVNRKAPDVTNDRTGCLVGEQSADDCRRKLLALCPRMARLDMHTV
ncbi:centrosomal protein of 97 kDa-like [Corticium candelabrum]|uniref:centrosomal protein of 97 kDa-like n=1 Tax=Corticium candelabrum TaxID=121492 RepID=UPI002E25F7DF|nr:centrosomal protein of 97 kDa-like [Corticium candelabrum]